ncbi:unnamed protein product, partial [Symbiodinium microadriaticum]
VPADARQQFGRPSGQPRFHAGGRGGKGTGSLAGWREAARSALLEPTVHGEAVRR